jgi:hypothetical protein
VSTESCSGVIVWCDLSLEGVELAEAGADLCIEEGIYGTDH